MNNHSRIKPRRYYQEYTNGTWNAADYYRNGALIPIEAKTEREARREVESMNARWEYSTK